MLVSMARRILLSLLVVSGLASPAMAADGRVFAVSLMSPTGKLELSSRVEEISGRFFLSSLATGKTGGKIGRALSLRLEKPGALVDADVHDGKLKAVIVRVVDEPDGTPALVPMSVEGKVPVKGVPSTFSLPDGSILAFSVD